MLRQAFMAVCLLPTLLPSAGSSPMDGSGHVPSNTQSVSGKFNPDRPSSLVLLQMLFRHGDRSPIHVFSWDEHESAWPQGTGQLTKLGMKQAYEYGKELRQRYAAFLPPDYNRSAIEVHSTDYDRTLMTVQCMLVGLFPANMSDWALSPWQPIPIHTQSVDNDHLFTHAPCPKLDTLNDHYDDSERAERFSAKYKPLFEELSNKTGTSVDQKMVHGISDTMFCEAQHNMSRPQWMTEEMFQKLMDFRNETNSLNWMAPGAAKLAGGPLLEKMTSNMDCRAQNAASTEKLFLFSAHDSTVSAVGRAMGFFNDLQPPYLTNIIVELHQQGSRFFVRTWFDNHTQDSPYLQTVGDCAHMCPLEEFRRVLKERMMPAEEREKACALTTASKLWKENGASILTGVVAVLMVTVAVLAYKLRKAVLSRRERGNIQYQKLLLENTDNEEDAE